MNPRNDGPISTTLIDRLVDGELPPADRRALLHALEADPNGWRRCALAFLEDQAWRQALSGPISAAAKPEKSASPDRVRRFPLRCSVAAGIMAATFALGFALGGRAPDPAQPGLIANRAPESIATPPKPNPLGDEVREVGWINLVDPQAGETPPERLPILAGTGLDDRWLRARPPTVSPYQRAQWERQGYQVEEHRRLVSVTLDDGRRVSIPFDEVAVEYVGHQPL